MTRAVLLNSDRIIEDYNAYVHNCPPLAPLTTPTIYACVYDDPNISVIADMARQRYVYKY